MLHELEILEARHIADLAWDARRVRDRLLEKVPDSQLGEPVPARGEHNPSGSIALNSVLAAEPECVALHAAIAALPRDIRDKLWVVAQIGRGDVAILDWDETLAGASALSDDDIVAGMVAEPDLHEHLRKGLYELGAAESLVRRREFLRCWTPNHESQVSLSAH
jgi:hypothetical protein